MQAIFVFWVQWGRSDFAYWVEWISALFGQWATVLGGKKRKIRTYGWSSDHKPLLDLNISFSFTLLMISRWHGGA